MIITLVVVYMLCKQSKLKALVANIALQWTKAVEATDTTTRKMAKSLNSRCDFKEGFFSPDLPEDTAQLVMRVETKCEKHTLKEEKDRITEKYRSLTRQTDRNDSRCPLASLTNSASSDSGAWLPTPEFEYRPKIFDDPRNSESSKENMPPLEPIPMSVLNVAEANFLDRTEK